MFNVWGDVMKEKPSNAKKAVGGCCLLWLVGIGIVIVLVVVGAATG